MPFINHIFVVSFALLLAAVNGSAIAQQMPVRPARVPSTADMLSILRGIENVNKDTIAVMRSEAGSGSPMQNGTKLMKLGTALHQAEEARFLALLAQFEAQPANGKLKRPEINFSGSLKEFANAKQAFDQAYKAKTKWKPAALLLYGYALSISQEPLAVNILDRLTSKFPKSKTTQEGALALAHFYFDGGDLVRTQRELSAIPKGDSAVAMYKQYLQAWMEFLKLRQNSKNPSAEKILAPFLALVDKTKDDDSEVVQRIYRRALGDVIGLIADVGNANTAKSMLMKIEQPDAYRLVAGRIAERKLSESNLEAAYQIYKGLIKDFPNDKRNPQILVSAIEVAAAQNNVQRLVADCNTMVTEFVEESSAWFTANDEADLVKAEVLAKSTIYRYAVEMDRLFRAGPKQDKRLKSGATILYNLFATKFPKDRRAAEIKLNLAKLLYDDKNFARSATLTSDILAKYKKSPQIKDAGDLLLASTQVMYDGARAKIRLPAPGKIKNPLPLPDAARTYVDSLDLYLKTFPKAENADAIVFAAASVFFDFGDYDEAGDRIDRLVGEYPNSDFGIKAAYLMLGYYLLVKDQELLSEFQELCSKSAKLRTHPEIAPLLKRKVQASAGAQPSNSEPKPSNSNKPAPKIDAPSASPVPEAEADTDVDSEG